MVFINLEVIILIKGVAIDFIIIILILLELVINKIFILASFTCYSLLSLIVILIDCFKEYLLYFQKFFYWDSLLPLFITYAYIN